MGKATPVELDPRDTYRVSTASTRKQPHTTRATRQSIMMAMVPPERIPFPPLNWNIQGNMCPSRQNSPDQYSARAVAVVWAAPLPMGSSWPVSHTPTSTATTALSTSVRITTKVRGPPKVR